MATDYRALARRAAEESGLPNPYQQDFADAGSAYGTSPALLSHIARLESSYDPSVQNNWDSNAKAGIPSYGLMQFIEPTFKGYARHAREANPQAWRGTPMDWKNPRAQILAASWAIANGKGSAWATYERAKKAAGKNPQATPQSRSESLTTPVASESGSDVAALEFIFKGSPYEGMATARYQRPVADDPIRSTRPAAATKPAANIGRDYRWLQRMGQEKFGLRNDAGDSQTTGGRHTAGSEHYDGRAIDFGTAKNTRKQLNAWMAWARAQGLDAIDEGDHIHVSLPGSGV